ncbi:hypothetical protein LCGC14_1279580 [marine sediment metagenome]|uniref:Uncharacterized protein n=1 Tax=marine sediment metagenome TaxID=412755 RepID=A0A0F9NYR4_9ZZZZ
MRKKSTKAARPVRRQKRQLITAAPASIFGEVPEEIVTDPTTSMLHIKGYSDKRIAFEMAQRNGEKGEPVSHRFHFVRHTGQGKRSAEFRAQGYRTLAWDDLVDAEGNPKENDFGIDITETPAAERAPDGTVVAGDLQLMAVPASIAAGIKQRHDNLVRSQIDAGESSGGLISTREQSREVPL